MNKMFVLRPECKHGQALIREDGICGMRPIRTVPSSGKTCDERVKKVKKSSESVEFDADIVRCQG